MEPNEKKSKERIGFRRTQYCFYVYIWVNVGGSGMGQLTYIFPFFIFSNCIVVVVECHAGIYGIPSGMTY